MDKSFILCILICVFPWSVLAQAGNDSLVTNFTLPAVEVVSDRNIQTLSSEDFSLVKLNSLSNASLDLGAFMEKRGLATVLSNGPTGMASAVRYRGLSSDHTSMNWYGIPINSISLGTTDMSLIPVFFFDNCSFYASAGTQTLAGSNLGLAVNLASSRAVDDDSYVRLISSCSTMRNGFHGIELRQIFHRNHSILAAENSKSFRNGVLISTTKLFFQDIKNDFKYSDVYRPESPVIRQIHNDGKNVGINQDISWHWGKNSIEGHLWVQEKWMQLPVSMGTYSVSTALQRDQLMRSSLSFVHRGRVDSLRIVSAWLEDDLHYRDRRDETGNYLIDSRIQSKVFFNNANYQLRIHKNIQVQTSVAVVIPQVMTSNYLAGKGSGNWQQAGGGVLFTPGLNIFSIDARKEFRATSTSPSWTMSYQRKIESGKVSVIPGVQIAKRFRAPDMNELYWSPGGNLLLKPESGLNYKTNIQFKWMKNATQSLTANLQIYYGEISNWIQWIPSSSGYWSPVNYKIVRTKGVELPVECQFKAGKMLLDLLARYQYTQTIGVNSDRWSDSLSFKMIYTPEHTATFICDVSYQRFNGGFSTRYTSSRFTDESNSSLRSLDAYFLSGFSLGFAWNKSRMAVQSSVEVTNLFNVAYESIRSFAMPGRVFQLNLQMKFLNNHKKSI